MNTRSPIPLRPDPAAIARRHRRSLSRAIVASARAEFESDRDIERLIDRDWPRDEDAALILRAASSPMSTANAPALLYEIVEAVVLGATGAGTALLQRGTLLSFGRD